MYYTYDAVGLILGQPRKGQRCFELRLDNFDAAMCCGIGCPFAMFGY